MALATSSRAGAFMSACETLAMATIQAVIFDFGGVIIPGTPVGQSADDPYWLIEQAHGLPGGAIWRAVYSGNEAWGRLRVGAATDEEWHSAALAAVKALTPQNADAVVAQIMASRPQGVALAGKTPVFIEGMIALVEQLRADGYRVGLLSNAAPGLEDDLRDHYRLDAHFDDIINSRPNPVSSSTTSRRTSSRRGPRA
jgi:FMN phosphatase YigB (HAD superfamily)